MAHYATLADYRFSDDVRDIRGARVYGEGGENIGKVDDVLFDHANGDIRGLVVDTGKRDVLISTAHLFRYPTDENDFQTDLRKADLDRLPEFDTKHLRDDERWKEFERRQEEALKRENQRLEQEYKREFVDDPVEHRQGSDRLITPEADEMPVAGEREPYRVTGADLTPERLAGKFPSTASTSDKLHMRPDAVIHAEDQAHAGLNAPNWTGFQNTIRQNLRELRRGCSTCEGGERKIA